MKNSWFRALTFSSATLVLTAWSMGGCGGDDDSSSGATGGSSGKGGSAGKSSGGSGGKSGAGTGGSSAGKGGTGGSSGKGGSSGTSAGGKGGSSAGSSAVSAGQAGEAGGGGKGGSSGSSGQSTQPTPCEVFCDGEHGVVAECTQDDVGTASGDGGAVPTVYADEAACKSDCATLSGDVLSCRQGHVDQIVSGGDKSEHCPPAYGVGGC